MHPNHQEGHIEGPLQWSRQQEQQSIDDTQQVWSFDEDDQDTINDLK
jgi:hypothetical protein